MTDEDKINIRVKLPNYYWFCSSGRQHFYFHTPL